MDNYVQETESYLLRWLNDPTAVRVVVLIGGLVRIQFVVRLVHRALQRAKSQSPESVYTLKKVVSGAGYVLALLLLSSVFRDKLGGLTVAFGVAGAGIAFALQEVIASVAGWVAVSAGNFYRVGDRVLLGGIRGDVIDIGWIRTTLMECGDWVAGDLYNGRIVRISNSFVFKEPVFNYSGDFPFLWDELRIPVKYGTDWKRAEEILHGAAADIVGEYVTTARQAWKEMVKNYKIENAMVDPMVTLVANDNWIELTLR